LKVITFFFKFFKKYWILLLVAHTQKKRMPSEMVMNVLRGFLLFDQCLRFVTTPLQRFFRCPMDNGFLDTMLKWIVFAVPMSLLFLCFLGVEKLAHCILFGVTSAGLIIISTVLWTIWAVDNEHVKYL